MRAFVSRRLLRIALVLVLAFSRVALPAAAPDEPASDTEPASVLILPPFLDFHDSDLAMVVQKQLIAGARDVLQATGFNVVDQPVLNVSEEENVRDHFRLFLLVAASMKSAKTGGKAWLDVRRSADYRIGDGLRFLAARTGASQALIIAGGEAYYASTPALQFSKRVTVAPAYPIGNAVDLVCGLVELQTGRLVWYNLRSANKAPISLRSESNARDVIAALFKNYPESPGLIFTDRTLVESRP